MSKSVYWIFRIVITLVFLLLIIVDTRHNGNYFLGLAIGYILLSYVLDIFKSDRNK